MQLKIKINSDRLDTPERRKKALLVATEMEIVINSDEFKKNFLAINHLPGELSIWKDATITAIFNYLMNGSETLDPTEDNELDLFVDDYYTFKNVVGHTYETDRYIYANIKYFDVNSSKNIGSFFLHEYGHKKGFSHDFRATARRKYSLCYWMNYIYEKTWDEILGETSAHDKVLVCRRTWYGVKKCSWINSDAVEIA